MPGQSTAIDLITRFGRELRSRDALYSLHRELGGKVDTPITVILPDGKVVAETMNKLAAQLDARINDVLRQGNEREAILSSMIEGAAAIDDRQRIISFNQAADLDTSQQV